MFEFFFLFIYMPRRIRRVAREKGESALLWWLLMVGAWLGVETAIVVAVGVIHSVGVELWGWSADESKVAFVGLGYIIAFVGGALAGSFVVSKLHKTSAKVGVNPDQYGR
jgi:hypothetical protein